MKRPFVVGDRVRVYGPVASVGSLEGHPEDALPGTVRFVHCQTLEVEMDWHGGLRIAHPKQCRRLVRKERRRVWVTKDARDDPKVQQWAGFDENVNYGQAEYVQYRKPK